MAHWAGLGKKLVEAPGFHIRPKYDLHHLRMRQEGPAKNAGDGALNLTAMIDMFSTLVIFLLLNFSATGEAFFVSKNIVIPEATHARPLESLPLVSITKSGVSLDAEQVGANPMTFTENDWEMPGLVQSLRRLKGIQHNLEAAGVKPRPEVNIQADQDVPVLYIKRVMNVLISEGFTGINFAVRETNENEGG